MDTQDDTFAAIIDRDQSEECRAHPGVVLPAAHGMSFETPDGNHLVQLDSIGMLPIPEQGETIVLHDQPVIVDRIETAYTRLETGRPQIYTQVVVIPVQ
ncbi:hypothetical protein ACIRJR_09430 [Streptomyces sp. NPDC102402]|uniref:hypothetical protein n=1 Tax=Streptomyces sp. NPDC102402 TaxID=3366169 RepID=UPI00381C804D